MRTLALCPLAGIDLAQTPAGPRSRVALGARAARFNVSPNIKRAWVIAVLSTFQAACLVTGSSPGSGKMLIEPVQSPRGPADVQLQRTFISDPLPGRFSVCHGNTCSEISEVRLTPEQWQSVRDLFAAPAPLPEQERESIRMAVARLEQLTGSVVGTDNDKGENRAGRGQSGQMDCVDEATNTTVYLALLEKDGLLRRHEVGDRVSRGVLTLQVPHFTATIRKTGGGERYAVDSWFLENGAPPFVVPLDEWRAGWVPGAAP